MVLICKVVEVYILMLILRHLWCQSGLRLLLYLYLIVVDVVLKTVLMNGGHIVGVLLLLKLLLHRLVVHRQQVALPEHREVVQGGLPLAHGVRAENTTLLKLVGSGQHGLWVANVLALSLRLMENHLAHVLLYWLIRDGVVLPRTLELLQLLSQCQLSLMLLLYRAGLVACFVVVRNREALLSAHGHSIAGHALVLLMLLLTLQMIGHPLLL